MPVKHRGRSAADRDQRLNLVNLIADIELAIFEKFGRDVVLADDAAASAARSPFRRVSTLVEYIDARLALPA